MRTWKAGGRARTHARRICVPVSALLLVLLGTIAESSTFAVDNTLLQKPVRQAEQGTRFWLPDKLETGWSAPDKKLHFLACYGIVLTGKVAADESDAGIAGAIALSAAKELWDLWFKTPPAHRGVSKRDLLADAAGIAAGILVVEILGD